MVTLGDCMKCFEQCAPVEYALDWDNVGLLLGNPDMEIRKVMIALDPSDYVVEQAIKEKVDLLVTHHPMIFKPLKKINTMDMIGRRIWNLANHHIAYYAMHTNFDVGVMGELVAKRIGLRNGVPLDITSNSGEVLAGIGQLGDIDEMTVKELSELVKQEFGLEHVMVYGDIQRSVSKVALCPGSGKSEIGKAIEGKAQVYITGDIGHHEGMDGVDLGLTIIDATHYGLEHCFVEYMNEYIREHMVDLERIPIYAGSPVQVL